MTPNQALIVFLVFVVFAFFAWFAFSPIQVPEVNLNWDGLTINEVINQIINLDHQKQLKQFKNSADYFILNTISSNGYPTGRWMRAFFNDGRDNFTFITNKNSGKVAELNANNNASAIFTFNLVPNRYTDIVIYGNPTVLEDQGMNLVYAFNPVSYLVYNVDDNLAQTYSERDGKFIKAAETTLPYDTTNTRTHPYDTN
jgi:hypothetical protein